MPADNANIQQTKKEQMLARLNEEFGQHSNEKFGMMGNLLDMEEQQAQHEQQEQRQVAEPVRTPADNKQVYEEMVAPLNSSIQEMKRQQKEQNEQLRQALQEQRQQAPQQQRQVQILPADVDPNEYVPYGAVKALESEIINLRNQHAAVNARLERERAASAYERVSNRYKDQGFAKEMPIETFQNQYNNWERQDPNSLAKVNWDAWLDQSFQAVQGKKAVSLADENAKLKKELEELRKGAPKATQQERNANLVPRSTISTPSTPNTRKLDMASVRQKSSFKSKGDGSFAALGRDLLADLGV